MVHTLFLHKGDHQKPGANCGTKLRNLAQNGLCQTGEHQLDDQILPSPEVAPGFWWFRQAVGQNDGGQAALTPEEQPGQDETVDETEYESEFVMQIVWRVLVANGRFPGAMLDNRLPASQTRVPN